MNAINPAIAAAIAAAKVNEDQSKVVAGGGGDYKPPAAGPCFARLVSYLELGKEAYDYKGTPKSKDRVRLVFELFGAKHPPTKLTVEGVDILIPVRITVNVNKSFGENGAWRKLFAKLNWKKDITHAAEALGRPFKLTVVHVPDAKKPEVIYANITDDSGTFLIDPARKEITDDVTNEISYVDVTVPPAITDLKCFLWDYCDQAQWDSIFIAGEYPEKKDAQGNMTAPARSKNSIQLAIKAATNYVGSPIYNLLSAGGDELDIPDADTVTRDPAAAQAAVEAKAGASTGAGADPLDGM